MTPELRKRPPDAPSRAGLVLCGGGSRRMGTDKAALPFGDQTLLERVVGRLASEVDELWVVAREGQDLPALRLAGRAVPVARDPAEGLGPLAGVVAGLRVTRAELAFVVSCDSPLLRPAFVARLFALTQGHTATIPQHGGHLVPTVAVYGRALLPAAEALLARGELRPRLLARERGVRVIDSEQLRDVDPPLDSLRDCDTPADYRDLLQRAGLDPPPSHMLDAE